MNRILEFILSKLFPPRLPSVPEAREARPSDPEHLGDGIVSHARPKKYRDGIERYYATNSQYMQQLRNGEAAMAEIDHDMEAQGYRNIIHDEWALPEVK